MKVPLNRLAPEAIVNGIITFDAAGMIITTDSEIKKIFADTGDELVGSNVCSLMTAPYCDEFMDDLIHYSVNGGRKVVGVGREIVGLRRDASTFPLELTFAETQSPETRVFIGLLRDISERKNTESALRESEERFRFLNDLACALRAVSHPDEVMSLAARMLGQHLRASRCGYATVAGDGDQFEILHDYADGCASSVGSYRLAHFGERTVETLCSGRTLVVSNATAELQSDHGAEMFESIEVQAAIVCPLVKEGSLRALMAIHQTVPREWLPNEIILVEDVVERCWSTIERAMAQEALQQQQSELRALFDLLPAMIWFKDTHNRTLRINQRVADAAGLSIDQIEGKPSHETYPLDAERFYQDDLTVILSGKPKLNFVETLRGPEGMERWVQTDKVPVKNSDGEVVGILVMAQDISERRRDQEQALLLGSAVEQSTESVIITDADINLPGPRILFVNPAFTKMTGYTAEEVMGQTPRILQGPDTDRVVLNQLRHSLESGVVFEGEAINYRKDGTTYVQHWQVVPLRNSDQRITHFVATLRDVTEEKKIEQALKQAFDEIEEKVEVRTAALAQANFDLRVAIELADASSKAKSEFLSRMSHELRTPMNSVLGYAQLLTLQYHDPAILESAGCIMRSGKHLLQMINEVLDLSRIESGELAISREPVEFVSVIDQAINIVQPLADASQVRMHLHGEGCSDLSVYADRQRLLQVLINVIGNGIKYNRRPGVVSITCSRVGEEKARVEISDTGYGIAESHRASLFQPFQRFGDLNIEGTGLGLALSQRYVKLMGGEIGLAESTSKGSVFFLELQIAEPTSTAVREQLSSGNGLTILDGLKGTLVYVEDNLSNMRLLEAVLDRVPDVALIPANQGSIGLEMVRVHRPDLILLDVHLPDMPGNEVLRRLKEDPETSNIPVVMLSADATQKQIDLLMSKGAADYLTKPIDLVRFFEVLKTFLPKADL